MGTERVSIRPCRIGDRTGPPSLLPQELKDPIVFFGGRSYVPLFCELTRPFNCRKIVLYNSVTHPSAPGCELKRFITTGRTNWHYQCANQFIEGGIEI